MGTENEPSVGRLFRAVEEDLERSSYRMTHGNSCKKLASEGKPPAIPRWRFGLL